MKKSLLITFATLCLCASLTAQTIRRVNNNAGVTGVNVYTTIQAAHDAASNGDIIYVEPTGVSVGSLECTKQLTIIGNGYFLSENYNSGLTPNKLSSSIVDRVTFRPGSSNSKISGIWVTNSGLADSNGSIEFRCISTENILGNVSGITVERCYLFPPNGGGSGDIYFPIYVGNIAYSATKLL